MAASFDQKTVALKSGEEVGYLEKGSSGAKHTLLCLHGMTMNADSFVSFITALQLPDGIRVLIPEAMAHGSRIKAALRMSTNYAGWTASERAEDAVAFLTALGDVDGPVDVYGYSMGGATALALAANHPETVDRVCLLAPAAAFTEISIEETRRGYIVYSYATEEESVAMAERIGFPTEVARSIAQGMADSRAGYDAKFVWSRTWTGLLSDMGADAWAMLEACRVQAKKPAAAGKKLLLIQGAEDMVVHRNVPSTIQEAMGVAQCQVTILPGLGHFGNPTNPAENLGESAGAIAGAFFKRREVAAL